LSRVVNKLSQFFIMFGSLLLVGCATQFGKSEAGYHEKATYLYRFVEFIEWPEYIFRDPKSPMVVGILGGNPFGDDLDKIVKSQNVNGHPLVVRRMTPFSDLKQCQILFINRSIKSRLPLIFNSLAGGHTLTVSDADGFLEAGGMIHFFVQEGKVRFEINRTAVDKAGLKIDSQMLIMAKHLKPDR
jgi:hypothetical protein